MDKPEFKYWEMVYDFNGFRWVYCPAMDRETTLSEKREIYKELKLLEFYLSSIGLIGWVAGTNIENSNIVKFMAKYGAQPYKFTKEADNFKVWVFKLLKQEV